MVELGEPARVSTDLPCAGCGYNLRTLAEAGVCPECGYAVRRTMERRRTDPLAEAPPRFYRHRALGFVLCLGSLFFAAAACSDLNFDWAPKGFRPLTAGAGSVKLGFLVPATVLEATGSGMRLPRLLPGAWVALSAVAVHGTGVLLLTGRTRRWRRSAHSLQWLPAVGARVLAGLALAVMVAVMWALYAERDSDFFLFEPWAWALMLVADVAQGWLVCSHGRALAERAGARWLARLFVGCEMLIAAGCAAALVALLAACLSWSWVYGFRRSVLGGPATAPETLLGVGALAYAAAGVLSLVAFAWAAWAMWGRGRRSPES